MVKSYSTAKRKHVRYKKAAQFREDQQKVATEQARIREQNQARLLTLSNEVKCARTFIDGKANVAQAIAASPYDPQISKSAKATKVKLKAALQAYSAKVGQYDAAIVALKANPDTLLM